MSRGLPITFVIAATLLGGAPSTAAGPGAVPSPSASASPAPADRVAVTVRVGEGDPCTNDPGCRVGVLITPAGSDVPILEGVLDPAAEPSDEGSSLVASLAPGTYAAWVTAQAVTGTTPSGSAEPPPTVVIGGCGATLELLPGQPAVEVAAVMDWSQPMCGIVIEPRAPSGIPRPVLADPIDRSGPAPDYRPSGAPVATATRHGIRLELWVKDTSLRRGQRLLAHLRVTNVGGKTIRHAGTFDELRCPPIRARLDTAPLFDPGLTWTGVAATFKERFLAETYLTSSYLQVPARLRGPSCGEIGSPNDTLAPGAVVEVPLADTPLYPLGDQPLPGGTMPLTVAFEGRRYEGPDLVSVSTDIALAGGPVEYASPVQLVDAALSTPGFVEMLGRTPDPRDWANSDTSYRERRAHRPYANQPRLAAVQDLPDGYLEIMQFLAPRGDYAFGFVVGAVLDPWTGESFGSSGF